VSERTAAPWEPGKCRVPMWQMGAPAGFCGKPTRGPQAPLDYLRFTRGRPDWPYCSGPCCEAHGGPREGEPIIFQDGYTEAGRPMWCAVRHDFENLQESPAGFSGDARLAVIELAAAIKALGHPAPPNDREAGDPVAELGPGKTT
jgi:hypothetical protein